MHFYSLDALRGLGAFAVVFYHWQHFFYRGATLQTFVKDQQPLFAQFKPFYTNGWRAVDLFFCLSGFIFFWLYSDKIHQRRVSITSFSLLRFSRLYPLHLATLLAVAVGQQVMMATTASYFVYPYNDAYHFMLQTLFISSWGFAKGDSFNGPIWSVSIEMFLYSVFFIVSLLNLKRWWQILFFAFAGYLMIKLGLINLGRGVLSYFLGGLSFMSFSALSRTRFVAPIATTLIILTAALWVIIPVFLNSGPHLKPSSKFSIDDLQQITLLLNPHRIGIEIKAFAFELFLFPLTVLSLALWENQRGPIFKPLALLGDISYSSYLLHFPLQLLFILVATSLSLSPEIFYHPLSLGLFFALLIPLSWSSFHFLERPCQKWLRKKFAQS
ncbi:MAG: acyltransferase [Luteolibacter sp.]